MFFTEDCDSGSLCLHMAVCSSEVDKMIILLDRRFTSLKNTIRKCVEKRKMQVKEVADVLTSLLPDEDDYRKMFTVNHVSALFNASNVAEQFGIMNSHWSYLYPSLLDHLVRRLDLQDVEGHMKKYKSDLFQFRKNTPLTLFCQTQKRRHVDPPPNFRKMVAEFDWPQNVTLEVVEQFRLEYADSYNLHVCAMMLAKVRPGSFVVTWFVPKSVIQKLKTNVPRAILKKYFAVKLEVAGTCVYRLHKPKEVSMIDVL